MIERFPFGCALQSRAIFPADALLSAAVPRHPCAGVFRCWPYKSGVNLELLCLVPRLGKPRIIEFLLHKQIRILRLQALDGGQRFQRKIIKRLLRGLVDDDVALMRIVVFLGIPGLAIGGVDISGLGITCSL